MKQVLILNPYYYPGYRSGGPQRTVMNIADTFGDVSDIYIVTQNHDMGESEPYPEVPLDEWVQVGKAKVKYLNDQKFSFRGLREEYSRFERVYTCGLFEKNTLLILLVHYLSREKKQLYVAPMGVFSPKALAAKALKKHAFLHVYKALGLFKNITWSFTSEMERQQAEAELGKRAVRDCIIAEDLPRSVDFDQSLKYLKNFQKAPGELRIVFLSRVSPKKNLLGCFEILDRPLEGEVIFDIYGTMEDKAYWNKCKRLMDGLPENVKATYCGEVNSENVVDTFRKYDVFLFPTKGENYGHVIYEALAAGCLPILADTTPWRDLDGASCGNVLPFDDISAFQAALQNWMDADKVKMSIAKERAVRYAEEKAAQAFRQSGYIQILT